MYRFLYFLILVSVGQPLCKKSSSWPWTSKNQNSGYRLKTCQTSALEIAQEIVEVDRKIQRFCDSYASQDMREIYSADHYEIKVRLDFSENDIVVKIMHRIVLVRAEDCSKTYANVKQLPEVVDPKRATWKYSQGELVILFPYKMASVSDRKCGGVIDESIVIVPRQACEDCDAPNIDVRFGGDGLVQESVLHSSTQATQKNDIST